MRRTKRRLSLGAARSLRAGLRVLLLAACAGAASDTIMAAPLNPRDIVVGVAGADIGLIAIDPNTGDPTRISGWFDDGNSQPTEIGVGPEFSLAYGVHRTSDNQIVVVTGMLGGAIDGTTRIVKVDPATGNRSLLLDSDQFNRPLWGAGPAIQDPYGSALESDNKLLVTDSRGRILRVDLTTGDRTIVSDETHGQGPALNTGMLSLARGGDGAIYVGDSAAQSVLRVDPVTGDRSVVSGPGHGAGPQLDAGLQISGLTVDPQGRLILAPEAQPYLYRVDLATGDRAIINNPDYVPGGMFATIDLALDADQSLVAIRYDGIFRFAAGATWGSTLVEYYRDGTYYRGFVMPAVPGDADFDDAVTGADYTYWADHFQQSAIHGARDGDFNRDGVVDGADYTIWADNFQSATGAAIAVPEPSAWRLIVLGGVLTLMARWAKARWTKACVPAAGVLLLSAVGAGSMVEAATIAPRSILGMDYGVGVVDGDLVALDQLSGQITTIAQSSPEDGVFDRVRSISWSPEGGGAAYLLRGTPGWRAPAVPRVDTSTGAITYAYELNQQGQPVNPNGPALANPLVMAREPSGMLLIADSYGRLIRLDPNSGARAMLSDDTHGNGPLFNDYLFGLTVLPQGSIFVAGLHAGAIFQVDPVTGDRQIVSGAGVGAGPEFGPLQSVFMDTQHSLIVNTFREGQVFGQFYRVDIATGERTLLPVVGQPPPAADAFAVDADRTILMSTVIGEIYRYDPTTGTTIRLEYDYGAPRFDGYAIVPALPGDGDLDNAVTAEDYTIWSDSLRQAAPRGARDGDFNRDGVVDGADYTLWADNFQPVATAAIAVPEPATLSLLIAACAGYCLHAVSARRRRKARSASRSAV